MAEKAHEVKAPAPEVVEKAQEKAADGADLSVREQQALAEQAAIDEARGYRRIEWKPGVWMWQHLATQHTTPDGDGGEAEMRRAHLEYLTSQAR